MYKLFYYTTKLQKIIDITKQFDTFSCKYFGVTIKVAIFAACDSHWDRYLGMTAAMTQIPVPSMTIQRNDFRGFFRMTAY